MPAAHELRRLGLAFLLTLPACAAAPPLTPENAKNTIFIPSLAATPVPTEIPTPIPQPKTTTPETTPTPRPAPTIRTGPLPTADIPELRRPLLQQTKQVEAPKPKAKPTETENETPPTFERLWKIEVPIAKDLPKQLVFTDNERCYMYTSPNTLSAFDVENGDPLWTWRTNPSSMPTLQPADYHPSLLFAQQLGTLQIGPNRLLAPTIIQAIDKNSKGVARIGWAREWQQPPPGNQQFFYHDGIIERVLSDSSINTTFEAYSPQTGELLWKDATRISHTNVAENIAVNMPNLGTASQWWVAELSTGKNKKPIFEQKLGNILIPSYSFDGTTMYAIANGKLYSTDLKDLHTLWTIDDNKLKGIQELVLPRQKTTYIYVKHGSHPNTQVSAIEKSSGEVVWTTDVAGLTIVGEANGVLFAKNEKERQAHLLNFTKKERFKVDIPIQNARPDDYEVIGSYKQLVVVRQVINAWIASGENGKMVGMNPEAFKGFSLLSGRVFVGGNTEYLRLTDVETGKQTITEKLSINVLRVVSPRKRVIIIQTGGPVGSLSAYKV